MIIGIGTDMAAITRIAETLSEHDRRFIERCFDPIEQAYVDGKYKDATARAGGYAKRWAAKEACAKALGQGIRDEIFLKDIVVTNDKAGKPELILRGGAKDRLSQLTPDGHVAKLSVSLSDDGNMALAFVVITAEKKEGENRL
jgi:holo-[acyl-carrier protein] synthase